MKNHVTKIKLEKPKSKLDLLLSHFPTDSVSSDSMNYEEHLPDAGKYYLIPESKVFLRSYINNFTWELNSNTIKFEIKETANLSSVNWILKINDGSLKENITIIIQDNQANEINRIKFIGLELLKHKCKFENRLNYKEFNPVSHKVCFTYSGLFIGVEKLNDELEYENDDKEYKEYLSQKEKTNA